jgi:hypothetical protein
VLTREVQPGDVKGSAASSGRGGVGEAEAGQAVAVVRGSVCGDDSDHSWKQLEEAMAQLSQRQSQRMQLCLCAGALLTNTTAAPVVRALCCGASPILLCWLLVC